MPITSRDAFWNIGFVKADQALALLPQRGASGAVHWGGVRVAHLDTGYTHHPALGFPADAAAGDLSAIVAADEGDFYRPARGTAFDPLDPFELLPGFELQPVGHGTFSSSVMVGRDTAAGFRGVAPGLPLASLRITDGSVLLGDRVAALVAALNRVVDQAVAPVVNISVGAPLEEPTIRDALTRAYEAGIIVVCAGGQIIEKVVCPARFGRAISVGGLRLQRQGSMKRYRVYARYDDFSLIDCWAPAAPIVRGHVERPGTPGAGYRYGYFDQADGTTYATTHVTAAAALWLRYHGSELDGAYGSGWKRVEAFRKLLKDWRQQLNRISDQDRVLLGKLWGKTPCLDLYKLLRAPLPAVADGDKAPVQRPAGG